MTTPKSKPATPCPTPAPNRHPARPTPDRGCAPLTSRLARALALLAALWMPLAATADELPNIVLIISDDQSFFDIAASGNDELHTPHLDRLTAEGTRFTHAYNMGSYSPAVCVASRSMLVTGQFLWHAQRIDRDQWADQGRYWPQLMREAGYHTSFAGKWHVPGANAQALFDLTRHIRPGMPNDFPEGYNRPIEGQPDPWSPSDPRWEGFWRGGTHWSEVLAEDAEHLLAAAAEAADEGRPFFSYLAFNAPHDPRQAPQEDVDRYPQAEVRLPANFLPEYPYNEAMASGRRLRDERLAPFPRTDYSVRVHRSEYYAIITHMDRQIGRILEAIEATGQADNTYVFFTSDHGLAVGQHGLFGKQNMYDHSLRVPFIVRGPGIAAGKVIDTPIYLQDVMPTALELAGVEIPETVHFNSLLPLLQGTADAAGRAAAPPYAAIYGAYLDRQRAVIVNGHKLILYPTARRVRLYDLETDPDETNDLAADPDMRPRMTAMLAALRELQEHTGDTLDLDQAFGDPDQWITESES